MKRFATLVTSSLLLACADLPLPVEPTPEIQAGAAVSAGRPTLSNSLTVPADVTTFVACAFGGAGEMVNVTGSLHVSVSAFVSASGNTHSKFQFRWAEMHGHGMTSGNTYSANGIENSSFHEGPGLTSTLVRRFILNGHGAAPDLRVHETFHVTANANGDISVNRSGINITCN